MKSYSNPQTSILNLGAERLMIGQNISSNTIPGYHPGEGGDPT